MSTQGDWPSDPDDQYQRDPWAERPPQRRGMSTGAKILIVLLSLAGVVVLLCCGVGVYIFSSSQLDESPAAAEERAKQIVEIDIPEAFVPRGAMHLNMLIIEVDAAIYELEENPEGILILAEISGLGMDSADVQSEIRRSLGRPDGGGELTITRSETREFQVRGERVPFVFAESTDEAGNEYRLVSGSFRTDDGQGLLSVQVPPEEYDEEAVVEMIESIK